MSEYCHNCKNLADQLAAVTADRDKRLYELMREVVYWVGKSDGCDRDTLTHMCEDAFPARARPQPASEEKVPACVYEVGFKAFNSARGATTGIQDAITAAIHEYQRLQSQVPT